MHNKSHFCSSCGYYLGFSPWGEDGNTPDYSICSCCGIEFGNEDYTLESLKEYRAHWLINGSKWFDEKMKPVNWDIHKQMANIPFEYRE